MVPGNKSNLFWMNVMDFYIYLLQIHKSLPSKYREQRIIVLHISEITIQYSGILFDFWSKQQTTSKTSCMLQIYSALQINTDNTTETQSLLDYVLCVARSDINVNKIISWGNVHYQSKFCLLLSFKKTQFEESSLEK